MGDLAGIGSIISGIGGIGIGIANSVTNAEINKKNYELQKDWQNYQKQLQREIFQREDSAIQRRASDIAAAGGNPAMAWETGNGASAGSIVDTSPPQRAHDDYAQLMNSSLAMFSGGLRQFQEARLMDAQIKNLNAVTGKTDAETITEEIRQLQIKALTAKTNEEKNLYIQEIKEKEHNLELSKEGDLRTTDPKLSMYNTIEDYINRVIPDNVDNLSSADLFKIGLEAGLFLLPGFGAIKAGSKLIPLSLRMLKRIGMPKDTKSFIKFFADVFKKQPTKEQIKKFEELNKKQLNNFYRDN